MADKRSETNPYWGKKSPPVLYLIYGTLYVLNVSSEEPGIGAGVLLRAIEPLEGISPINRSGERTGTACRPSQIDQQLDGVDLYAGGPLWLEMAVRKTAHIGLTVRIGIKRAADRPLRFYSQAGLDR